MRQARQSLGGIQDEFKFQFQFSSISFIVLNASENSSIVFNSMKSAIVLKSNFSYAAKLTNADRTAALG
jgi:hypothetical protein